jgi:uncharacterized membrane protein YjgN (DUF898 family)
MQNPGHRNIQGERMMSMIDDGLQAREGKGPHMHELEFSASGSEYFRIWIVNLLLIMLTLGIYLPWAKARKLKYFCSNTWVDGNALDFHGDPLKMLRGTLIAAAFLFAFSLGSKLSPWAALVTAIAFVATWPALFLASMRFRLANTSWRGIRFHFAGDLAGAYGAVLPPLAILLIPLALAGAMVMPGPAGESGEMAPAGIRLGRNIVAVFLLLLPYFLWRLKRYQHNHYGWGSLQTEMRAGLRSVYGVFLKTAGISFLVMGAVAIAVATLIFQSQKVASVTATVLVAIGGIVLVNVLPKACLQTGLQNLLWSSTGNRTIRFRSDLAAASFVGLQFKNYLLIFLTLGLYWPFAVVHSRRAQVEAVGLLSRIPLDRITQSELRSQPGATGDMAADLFGLDIGL